MELKGRGQERWRLWRKSIASGRSKLNRQVEGHEVGEAPSQPCMHGHLCSYGSLKIARNGGAYGSAQLHRHVESYEVGEAPSQPSMHGYIKLGVRGQGRSWHAAGDSLLHQVAALAMPHQICLKVAWSGLAAPDLLESGQVWSCRTRSALQLSVKSGLAAPDLLYSGLVMPYQICFKVVKYGHAAPSWLVYAHAAPDLCQGILAGLVMLRRICCRMAGMVKLHQICSNRLISLSYADANLASGRWLLDLDLCLP
eukprot:scaffold202176_cov19-Tisochrysis_lutea.AAC.1